MEEARERVGGRMVLRMGGEVVVIMIGVFAALAADQWRQERVEADLKASYLTRLTRDVRTDSVTWANLTPGLEFKETALNGVLDWLVDPDFDESSLQVLAAQLTAGSSLAYGAATEANRTAFDDLITSGHLDLLSDLELREALISYHSRVSLDRVRLAGRETAYAQRAYELVPRDPEFAVMEGLGSGDLRRIAERALSTDLESLVIAERNRSRLRREIAAGLSVRARALLALLERALE